SPIQTSILGPLESSKWQSKKAVFKLHQGPVERFQATPPASGRDEKEKLKDEDWEVISKPDYELETHGSHFSSSFNCSSAGEVGGPPYLAGMRVSGRITLIYPTAHRARVTLEEKRMRSNKQRCYMD
ncbi:hypothetical protein CT0861_09995, partial [Colletotrichum tofieldiae]